MAGRRFFDRLADQGERLVSHAAFFACCVLLIILWAPLVIWLKVDTWQLIINTATTIVTFLLLALLTNTQRRFELRTDKALLAIEARLDAVLVVVLTIERSGHGAGAEASGCASPAE